VLIVIIGPGGVGKGTVVSRVVERDPSLWLSRSWTTRPRREGEPADAYTFVDRPTFEDAVAGGRFLEWDEHFGNLYGTPIPEPPPGKDVVLEIDINGARQVRERVPDATVLLIEPPSRETLEQRLLARGDRPEDVAARLARADMEVEQGRQLADAVVVNDDLDRAVEEVAGILDRYRTPRSES
jgi:guanylate kinase